MKVNSLAVRIANFINNSHKTQKVLRKISDSPAVFSTVSASIIGFTLRPITTLAITKDKQDGKYGASSSIASSLVELGIGLVLLKPAQKMIAKSSQQLYNKAGSIFYQNKELLRNYKSVNNRLFKIFTLPISSYLRFSLVYPIGIVLNKLGFVKNKKADK